MIESEYDPFVKSSAGAAGLWQLMPHTGAELGIPKSWWVDGRRSIGPSTDAALNYLAYLHQFFHGNWKLAVAAYDSGPNRVSRAVKRNNKKSQFWSLSLPHETKAYIPHLLALSEIIQHPDRYNVQLPQIPHKPYFKEVEVDKHVNPSHAAKLAEVPAKDFRLLNPGFKDWTKHPSQPYKLLIPTEHVDNFYRNLANISEAQSKKSKQLSFLPQAPSITFRYTVRKGDSLNRIARRHHIKLSLLKRLNPKIRRGRVKPGQQIILS
jgi:membrane-bound lytic murein transglycosylase D